MDIIKINNGKYEEYEQLLMERDQVQKEAGQIWTVYQKRFGKLITDVFAVKIECIKLKKVLAYYQRRINHGLEIDQSALQEWLEEEMQKYQQELADMLWDYKNAKDSGTSTAYEVQRSKVLYRRIAKLIHPDMHPTTDRNETLMDLWNRTVIAFGQNNVKELSEIEVMVRKALTEEGIDTEPADIPDIDERIETLQEEIQTIKSEKPYTYMYMIEDEDACSKEVDKLEKELAEYKGYQRELDGKINELLQNGGVSIKWKMN